MLRAGLAGLGLALAAGPLGCFVVWRRMAYFGGATAHAAILGIALALALEVPVFGAVLVCALAMALLVSHGLGRDYATDTALGVAAHGALAAGLVALALLPGRPVDLEGYLFGDILAVTWADLAMIWSGGAAVLALLAWRWGPLLTATVSADLAAAEGGRPERERLVLMVALATIVAVGLKVVGALLITSMLIVPAAAARAFAGTPERMAGAAVGIGAASVVAGLSGSLHADLPAGPAIVVAAVALFALAVILRGPAPVRR
jgi:zinc transport system permease protein